MSLPGEQPGASDRRPFPEVPCMLEYVSTGERGNLRGVVGRAIINDDDLFGILLCTEDDRADCGGLVEGRNCDQHARRLSLCRRTLVDRLAVVSHGHEIPP